MDKRRITIYVDKKNYKKFQIQSLAINKSVSERIDTFIKSELEKAGLNKGD